MIGGAIRKLTIGGLEYPLSSDNDPNFTIGGRVITERQETTSKPYFLTDKISGVLSGLEARLGHDDGSLDNFKTAAEQCAENNPQSALVEFADGAKYTASGGAMIVISGAADGMQTIREGKLQFDLVPVNGKWIKA